MRHNVRTSAHPYKLAFATFDAFNYMSCFTSATLLFVWIRAWARAVVMYNTNDYVGGLWVYVTIFSSKYVQ